MPSVEQEISRRSTRSSKQVEPEVKPNKQGGNGKGSKKGKAKGKVVVKSQPVEVITLSSDSDPFHDKKNPFKKDCDVLTEDKSSYQDFLTGLGILLKAEPDKKGKKKKKSIETNAFNKMHGMFGESYSNHIS